MPRARTPTLAALIPARSGSKRVPDKNVRPLAGHPLMAYTLAAALESGVFDIVAVSTDSKRYAAIGRHYGADRVIQRPSELAGERSPDVEWVAHALAELERDGIRYECFSILRPTSPFRSADTIRRAWREFRAGGTRRAGGGAAAIDSLRAVEPCAQHPGKMWVIRQERMLPLLPLSPETRPWHSSQYAALPEVLVQNASLEIAWSRVVRETGSIAGTVLAPFRTRGLEGFDINDERDWWYAEHLVHSGEAELPAIPLAPFDPEGTEARESEAPWGS